MFEWAQGVALDRVKAMNWYRKAAEQGNAKAQASLGRLLASGLVGKRDRVEAYYWLWKGTEQNEPTAINFLKDMVPGMTEEERKAALARIGMAPR
jgi:TPR repeat protein